MDNISIVFACDNCFAFPMTIAAFSVLSNLGKNRKAELFIIYNGINKNTKTKIEKILRKTDTLHSIEWITMDLTNLKNLYTTKDINQTTYLRILVPDLIPQKNKVIYLDSDILVKGDLSQLWDEDLLDAPLGGIQDFFFHTASSHNVIPNYKNFALNEGTVFCNAGVLLMNLKLWREEEMARKIMRYLETTHQNDQQGINAIIGNRWKLYSPVWNVTLSSLKSFKNNLYPEYEINHSLLINDAKIIHYTSKYKPWQLGYESGALVVNYYAQRERNTYFSYVKESKWFSSTHFQIWIAIRKTILFFGKKLPLQLESLISK
ncbi:glycosyltransferase family 8 protein [Pedobacter agri]|uniref:Glycosyltransferase family 8 protein n=1 Tax=Pedobacter agri TaxID=454586 RepID=A0A9X3I7C9_9SPHI|nr:glycosyltransferase family 8 protein [Pedobacter agri]MCX3263637.1 glycosyltransferase family 8 protein [Pedobacter agri]